MRTTLNIDEDLIKKLLKTTQIKSKTKAISMAIEEYLERHQIQKILSYQGSLDMEDNWELLEEEEMREYEAKNE